MTINVVVHWIVPTSGFPLRLTDRGQIARRVERRGREILGASFISAAAVATLDGVRASFNFEQRSDLDLIVSQLEDLGNGPGGFAYNDVHTIAPSPSD